MSDSVLLSIIIPIYNTEKYLDECLHSVESQSFTDYEVIMVDDGSSDNSLCIAKAYTEKNCNWFLFQNAHEGVSTARNTGIIHSHGKYVFFLDSDDRIESRLLELLTLKMEAHKGGMGVSYLRTFGRYVSCNLSLNPKYNIEYLDGESALASLKGGHNYGFESIGGKMIRKDLLPEGFFRKDISNGEDTLLLYEVLLKKSPVVFTDDAFYEYRIHDKNSIFTHSVKHIENVYYVRKYIWENEAAQGRTATAKEWYIHTVEFFDNFCKKSVSIREANETKKCFKQYLKKYRRESMYSLISKHEKLKITLLTFSPFLFRLLVSFDIAGENTCCGCGACTDICPNKCITMKSSRDGFRYPVVKKKKCTNCGLCKKICPLEGFYDIKNVPNFYGLKASLEIRSQSTSGGAFKLLALDTLSRGGVVVGASMEKLEVKHILVDKPENLDKLCSSKYVQSNTSGIYSTVLTLLKEGREVLFSGTPCQVEAMRCIAGSYSNLLLVDLICNGVASPGMWKKYTKLLSLHKHDKLLGFSFRDKRNHDDGHTVSMKFAHSEKTKSMYDDLFCKSYFSGISKRRKCTSCLFCTSKRQSDITLGDFWGVENSMPEWNDGMGTSLVITHTEKGEKAFTSLKEKAAIVQLTEKQCRQPRLFYPDGGTSQMYKAKRAYSIMPYFLWLHKFCK